MEDNEIKKMDLDNKSNQITVKDKKEDTKKTKKPKIEINFETYLKEKKTKVNK